MEQAVLRHGLPLAGVELAAQLARLAELAAVGRCLGLSALAAVCSCLIAANLVMAPVAHVTASVVAHLAVQPVADGTIRRRRDGRAQAAAALALAALISLPISLLYYVTPALLARLQLPDPVLLGAGEYMPTLVLAVAPGLLQAAALGYLRAWQRLPTASLVIVATTLAYIWLLPRALSAGGLRGAAVAVAVVHAASLLSLLAFHRNAFRAREQPPPPPPVPPPPPPPPLAAAAAERLRDLCAGFPFAALLATLRAGPAPMLVLFSLYLGCDEAAVAAISILFALLQVCLAPWVAMQLSVLTFAAKYLSQHRTRAAYDLLWTSLLLISILATAVAVALWPLTSAGAGSPLLSIFGLDPRLAEALAPLFQFLPALVFLKASSGLLGSYLAATGYNGEIGAAYCAFHWLASLPLAYAAGSAAAAASGPAAAISALVRVHTAAWGLTAAAFGVGYSCAVARSIPRPDVLAAVGNSTSDRAVPGSTVPPGGIPPGFVTPPRPAGVASPVRTRAAAAGEIPRGGRDATGSAKGRPGGPVVSPLREPLLPGPGAGGGRG